MNGDQGAQARRPGTDGAGERPGLEVGAEMALGVKHEVEARLVRLHQRVASEAEALVDFAGRERRHRRRDGARHRGRADGDMGNRSVQAKLHGASVCPKTSSHGKAKTSIPALGQDFDPSLCVVF